MTLDLQKYRASTIGLHGLEDEFKLCHLPFIVVDDVFGAVALEGSSGSGKTTLIRRLGEINKAAGGGSVGVFSADKTRYEDFIGFPIPDVENGRMKMYPSVEAVANMETLLIDEINRASYDNQEKWLSLLSSREIDSQKVECKYIFVAMNPVAGETGDQYEGTNPVDKALGERVMLLIQMPKFSDLTAKDKIKVITACKNQVKWVPPQETVQLHTEFVQAARKQYEIYKETVSEQVAKYICSIEGKIRKESKGSSNIRFEGRRAQFLLTNIIGVHALNKVYNNSAKLDQSALQALLRTFPNPLWNDPLNYEALEQAHELSKDILNLEDEERIKVASNYDGLEGPLEEILKAAKEKQTKESITKLIMQECPVKELDPINYFAFVYASTLGLKGNSDIQNVMKRNEYDRLEKAYNEVVASDAYKKAQETQTFYRENKTLPSGYTRPDYIENDGDPSMKDTFGSALLELHELVCYTLAIESFGSVSYRHGQDFMDVLNKLTEAVASFQEVAEEYV